MVTRYEAMIFRKATAQDIPSIAKIYDDIHTEEEKGAAQVGWIRGVYPTQKTAEAALDRGDLFVAEDGGEIVGTAIINQQQMDSYLGANWQYPAKDREVMVLHTLVISPHVMHQGYGKAFVRFYEDYARQHHCTYLRMDTNVRNGKARAMYRKLGYAEIGVVPCVFNGIEGVQLVLLEKKL